MLKSRKRMKAVIVMLLFAGVSGCKKTPDLELYGGAVGSDILDLVEKISVEISAKEPDLRFDITYAFDFDNERKVFGFIDLSITGIAEQEHILNAEEVVRGKFDARNDIDRATIYFYRSLVDDGVGDGGMKPDDLLHETQLEFVPDR
jgi:hypothetical protein